MTVEDRFLQPQDKSYKPSRHPEQIIIAERNVRICYKKSYGGMSRYFQGIMRKEEAVLYYSHCGNEKGHDILRTIRYQVPRADCAECYEKTQWKTLPDATGFFVETKSTAVELAGISFMNDLPVTVAWVRAVLPEKIELDTLAAGMVSIEDYDSLIKGDELRPVFRKEPRATASDVMWVRKGSRRLPEGYGPSSNYKI